MSFFGKNIKKIRGVKGLSQQAFAELFDLKRATLGAYEEGRSEPKIDTIIKIANYFSTSIDDLLTSELTVNALLQFKDDLTLHADAFHKVEMSSIPLLQGDAIGEYPNLYNNISYIEDLPQIQFPLASSQKFRAYTISNLEMTANDKGLYPGDIVIGEQVLLKDIVSIPEGTVVLILVHDKLMVRHLQVKEDMVFLKAAHKNIAPYKFSLNEVKEVWKICYTILFRLPEFGNPLEEKLNYLEREFRRFKEGF
ncbi:helix-turn-helix domain-containing protein [Tenacibaculum sp. SG-28]|uniref:helix-turn-helix domain-containing protein n=1 Tax=Tenacibaculum sp. SG-28 TaxID=754426 RepID=UPI000CF3EBD1|nr:helix-turn-helix transcriptional regulator [Tenacibaculum sp. SG-28]PQJ23029.1 transcriptional regulator [Tenacibaculum sp. SG-28]